VEKAARVRRGGGLKAFIDLGDAPEGGYAVKVQGSLVEARERKRKRTKRKKKTHTKLTFGGLNNGRPVFY